MKIRVCDICKKHEADVSYKVKKRKKGLMLRSASGMVYDANAWSLYQKIDICNECAEKLLNGVNNNDIQTRKVLC